MYSEGKAVVHLVDISRTEEPQKPDSGVVHHVAFVSRGFADMKQRLESKGFKYDSRQVPGGDLWQIFVDDPNGVMIELNYEAAKEQGCGSRRGPGRHGGEVAFCAGPLYGSHPKNDVSDEADSVSRPEIASRQRIETGSEAIRTGKVQGDAT